MIKYLTKNQIVNINISTINLHGGNFSPPFNFLHEENLDYLVETVQSEMFGTELYPNLFDKAALYCYNIICNHIFSDGNKRTGLGAALVFLNLNNCDLKIEVTDIVLTDFILKIASGNSSLDECKKWFATNIVSI
jgi:death on curing protein